MIDKNMLPPLNSVLNAKKLFLKDNDLNAVARYLYFVSKKYNTTIKGKIVAFDEIPRDDYVKLLIKYNQTHNYFFISDSGKYVKPSKTRALDLFTVLIKDIKK